MMIQGVEQEAYTYARAYRSLWNDSGSCGCKASFPSI
jgi:hypothetical protein